MTVVTSSHAIDVEIGRRIKARRRLMGLSQVALASSIGVSFQQVQKYEKGVNRVGASRLQQIARKLGLPVAYFFADLSVADAGVADDDYSNMVHFASSEEGIALNRAFVVIRNDRIRRRFLALVKALVDADN